MFNWGTQISLVLQNRLITDNLHSKHQAKKRDMPGLSCVDIDGNAVVLGNCSQVRKMQH